MPKLKLGVDVYNSAIDRIGWTFDKFDKISVSFSGGKDSTVMLHMVMDEAIKRGRRVAVLFIDLEGQYRLTIDHIQACYDMYADYIDPYWVCLPIHLRNAVSVYSPFWKCWDGAVADSWIREMPEGCVSDLSYFPFFVEGMEFEEFVPQFGEWYAEGEPTACFVGIRSDESLNRYRTIVSRSKQSMEGKQWTTKVVDGNGEGNVYNIYPIYDWKTKDIWTYHGKDGSKPYNTLYDYMYKAGLTINQMRICQPYGDDQRKGLWLFHLIEPDTWARLVSRVNGANGGALYVQEWGNINGYRKITKPIGHTWHSFATLLVNSMPPQTREHYLNKVAIFVKWWEIRGYPDGIPDEAEYHLEAKHKVPSWRRVCKSLLRNDYWCKGMSFTQQNSEAYKKYLALMKRKRNKWGVDSMESMQMLLNEVSG